jgi:hypothetical protein
MTQKAQKYVIPSDENRIGRSNQFAAFGMLPLEVLGNLSPIISISVERIETGFGS